jgi:ribosome-associated protein
VPDDLDEDLRVSRSLVIPASELTWRYSASGGPGGQHANTANTRVEVVFDVAGSSALGPFQRARLLERLGETVRAVAADERSQLRNRALARERLRSRLAEALHVPKVRRPTQPSLGAERRRLQAKSRRSETKAARRKPDPGE